MKQKFIIGKIESNDHETLTHVYEQEPFTMMQKVTVIK